MPEIDAATSVLLMAITEQLKKLKWEGPEEGHLEADRLLCEALTLLGQTEMVEAWKAVSKWYG